MFIDFNKRTVLEDYVKSSEDEVYFGLDIARGGEDYTSLTIMSKDGHVINREYWNEFDTETQIKRLIKILDEYPKIKRGVVETNQEVGIYQSLKKYYQQKFVIVDFYTTKKNKPDLIQKLATDIYNGDVLLPSRQLDEVLYDEFGDFSYDKKEDGYLKYSAPDGKHDDSVISTALANEARLPHRHIRRDWLNDFKMFNG